MAQKFQTGDQVQLKSNGPVMTVSQYKPDGVHVVCQWYADNKLESDVILQDFLQPASTDTKKL